MKKLMLLSLIFLFFIKSSELFCLSDYQGEENFLRERSLQAQGAWQKILSDQPNRQAKDFFCLEKDSVHSVKFPSIGLALSGGGMRAALVSASSLAALDSQGLLDTVTYVSTLSGSSWFLSSWLYHMMPIREFSLKFKSIVTTERPHSSSYIFKNNFFSKNKKNYFPLAWGSYITTLVLGSGNYIDAGVPLGHLKKMVDPGKHPYPLFSSLVTNRRPHRWFEISLDKVGFTDFFDMRDNAEKKDAFWFELSQLREEVDSKNELPISLFLGMVSSAYAIKSADFLRKALSQFAFFNSFSYMKERLVKIFFYADSLRLQEAKLINSAHANKNALFPDDKHLIFSDAGIACNIAVPPLLQRRCPVLIIVDASSTLKNRRFAELRAAEAYVHFQKFLMTLLFLINVLFFVMPLRG